MAKGKRTDQDVWEAIEAFALDHRREWSAASIERQLRLEKRFRGRVPTQRTIQGIVRQIRTVDPSSPWRLADVTGDDAAFVLPVLAALLETHDRQAPADADLREIRAAMRPISKLEAEWIVRLSRAVPPFRKAPLVLYRYAQRYVRALSRKEPTDALDRALAWSLSDDLKGAIAAYYEAPDLDRKETRRGT